MERKHASFVGFVIIMPSKNTLGVKKERPILLAPVNVKTTESTDD